MSPGRRKNNLYSFSSFVAVKSCLATFKLLVSNLNSRGFSVRIAVVLCASSLTLVSICVTVLVHLDAFDIGIFQLGASSLSGPMARHIFIGFSTRAKLAIFMLLFLYGQI